jgi:hypothetical protein
MISDERIAKGIQLRSWSKQDDDVSYIIAATCSKHEVASYGELAEEYPATFDELYETIADLLEESPSIGRLPGFMQ